MVVTYRCATFHARMANAPLPGCFVHTAQTQLTFSQLNVCLGQDPTAYARPYCPKHMLSWLKISCLWAIWTKLVCSTCVSLLCLQRVTSASDLGAELPKKCATSFPKSCS